MKKLTPIKINLKAVRALRGKKTRRLKVVSMKMWSVERKKQERLFKRYRGKEIPPDVVAEMNGSICEDHRYLVTVTFAVPKRVHPMSFDACFSHAVGCEWSDGAGTMFSQARKTCRRDLDFLFPKKAAARLAATGLTAVLLTHRLKGEVVIEDMAWDPPRQIATESR